VDPALKVASSPELDDVTLARAQSGDRDAMSALVEVYKDRVFALIWRMLLGHGTERAHDLAQDTFVRVLRGIAAFDAKGTAKLSTWILTVAMRVVMNERRRAGRDRIELNEPAVDAATVESAHERVQLAQALLAGIGALPDDQRAVFLLREYHELEYTEIAVALGIPENTVRSRLHRARTALREDLAGRGVVP
jgi:RNA polymerase sigma-70 factor (ECF subfamily)